MSEGKLVFKGIIISVQPRIRLLRSFDQRQHNYLGFGLFIRGFIGEEERDFSVGIGKAAEKKHQFCIGDDISGECLIVADSKMEPVEFYKVSKLKKNGHTEADSVPPELELYRQRGHRRLSAETYSAKCATCIWGCRMPVEIVVDQWKRDDKKYRFETFCYGPLSCALYEAGPTRKVEGRKGMVYEEEDWVDEEATAHRDPGKSDLPF